MFYIEENHILSKQEEATTMKKSANAKKGIRVLSAVMIGTIFLSLTACGGSQTATSSAAGSASAAGASSGKKWAGKTLTVCSWGGAIQAAQKKTIFDKFAEETGCTIVEDTDPSPAKVKAAVQAGKMEVDVWDVDTDFAFRGEKEGLFEKLDFNVIKKDGLVENFITEYSVPSEMSAICISWNTNQFSESNRPKNWTEFFDTAKFPGSRTLYSNPMSMLEAVLMADGVSIDEMYPLDVDRAFKYLDAHKKDIQTFWDSGSQSVQLVSSGDNPLGEVWAGRIIKAKEEGQPVEYDWNQAIITSDSWVIGKGSKNVEMANDFIAFATSAQVVADYAIEYPGNAPCNTDAYKLMTQEQVDKLASSPEKVKNQVYYDVKWWVDNYDAVYQRFQEWKLS